MGKLLPPVLAGAKARDRMVAAEGMWTSQKSIETAAASAEPQIIEIKIAAAENDAYFATGKAFTMA